MLVAGHETTGSALTWTLYLLATNPDKMAKAHEEVDRVMQGRSQPTMADYGALRCVVGESRGVAAYNSRRWGLQIVQQLRMRMHL